MISNGGKRIKGPIMECKYRQPKVFMVYLDFSKAFDLVSQVLLLQKLYMLGFDIYLIDRVQTFLQGRFMSVSVALILSVEVAVMSGSCTKICVSAVIIFVIC